MVRHKDNLAFRTVEELELPEKRHQHLLKDEIVELTGARSKEKYPGTLRRVAIWDDEN